MKDIEYLAVKFLGKYDLKPPIGYNELKKIVSAEGWLLSYYSSSKSLFKKYNLTKCASEHNAFTYSSDDGIFIFLKDNLTYDEKSFALAHEIGHILLDHCKNGKIGLHGKYTFSKLEKEADTFAYYVISYNKLNIKRYIFLKWLYIKERLFSRKINLTKLIICFIFFSIPIYILIFQTQVHSKNESAAGAVNAQTSEAKRSSKKLVYITQTGHKYHLPGCIHVRGKNDLEELTEKAAVEKGYTACKVCGPDLN